MSGEATGAFGFGKFGQFQYGIPYAYIHDEITESISFTEYGVRYVTPSLTGFGYGHFGIDFRYGIGGGGYFISEYYTEHSESLSLTEAITPELQYTYDESLGLTETIAGLLSSECNEILLLIEEIDKYLDFVCNESLLFTEYGVRQTSLIPGGFGYGTFGNMRFGYGTVQDFISEYFSTHASTLSLSELYSVEANVEHTDIMPFTESHASSLFADLVDTLLLVESVGGWYSAELSEALSLTEIPVGTLEDSEVDTLPFTESDSAGYECELTESLSFNEVIAGYYDASETDFLRFVEDAITIYQGTRVEVTLNCLLETNKPVLLDCRLFT